MAASQIFSSFGGLTPSRDPQEARTDALPLAPGTYAQGTAVGRVTSTTAGNDVQTLTITGTPTGGTFRLGFGDQVTAAITYSATDATLQANIQTALEALSNIGTGNVTAVSSSSGTSVAITFGGALANLEQLALTVVSNGLTGGTNPAGSLARTTRGIAAGGHLAAYDDARSDGVNVCRGFLKHACTVDTQGNVVVGEWGTSARRVATYYYAGTFYTAQTTGLDANGANDLGKMIVGTTSVLSAAGSELRIS